jgi:hypothetical protein
MELCTQVIQSLVTAPMNQRLIPEFIVTEVRLTFHQMTPFKAPGPDGFTADFYQHNCATIQDEVCSAILLFLNSSWESG